MQGLYTLKAHLNSFHVHLPTRPNVVQPNQRNCPQFTMRLTIITVVATLLAGTAAIAVPAEFSISFREMCGSTVCDGRVPVCPGGWYAKRSGGSWACCTNFGKHV